MAIETVWKVLDALSMKAVTAGYRDMLLLIAKTGLRMEEFKRLQPDWIWPATSGSVVETHSTPAATGRSIVIEATLATSDRPGFRYALKAARFIRPLMARAAHKLWLEDVAYAERAYALQQGRIITS